MNSLEQIRHEVILAMGALISAVLIGCGLIAEPPTQGMAPTAVSPTPISAFGADESHPVTDAVIPQRLPGMIGATRDIHLKSRNITLQLVEVLTKDSIPAIDGPVFLPAGEAGPLMNGKDVVIGLSINGEQKAYPTAFLSSHEIVNDVVGGVPVAVTW